MKPVLNVIIMLFFSVLTFAQPDIMLDEVASGFSGAIGVRNAGDSRLFVVERRGVIKIINDDGSVNSTAYLDIDNLVADPTGAGDERGLLGLAFHPDYQNNGFFYVNYVNNSNNTVVARYSVSGSDADIADVSSAQVLLTIPQPFLNHNGGDMAFGSDGYLYIATGDGGNGGDPGDRAQNLNTLLGKMLRIDVDSGSPYSIPPDNPFASDGNPNTLDEIWAYGLRNPWRFSFDSLNGDMWIGDVGQGTYEEINRVDFDEAGVNYGWRCYEANSIFNATGCPSPNTMTFPVGVYSHNSSGIFKCSITGGYRYRGSEFPNFAGLYFFADFCSDEIGTLEEDGSSWTMTFTSPFGNLGFVSFGEDVNGELYIVSINTGTIYKIVDGNLGIEEFNQSNFKMFPNPSADALNFQFNAEVPDRIDIVDLNGKLLSSIKEINDSNFSLNTVKFASGLYLVRLTGANGQTVYKKLVIK